jgi:hypothetical protein
MLAAMAARMLADGNPADLSIVETMFADDKVIIPMVFFKQFACVTSGEIACYSAVVETPNPMTTVPKIHFMHGDWRVGLRSFASVDVPTHLGLALDANGEMDISMAVQASFDFIVQPGTVIFQR